MNEWQQGAETADLGALIARIQLEGIPLLQTWTL
jgi:hypothetical protein